MTILAPTQAWTTRRFGGRTADGHNHRLYPKGSPAIPAWSRRKLGRDRDGFSYCQQEWGPDGSYHQMSAFEKRAGQHSCLTASGHPTVKVALNRTTLSSGQRMFPAYAAQFAAEDKARLVPGVAYNIQPINTQRDPTVGRSAERHAYYVEKRQAGAKWQTKPATTSEAEQSANQEIARLKLQHAEQELETTKRKVEVGLAPSV